MNQTQKTEFFFSIFEQKNQHRIFNNNFICKFMKKKQRCTIKIFCFIPHSECQTYNTNFFWDYMRLSKQIDVIHTLLFLILTSNVFWILIWAKIHTFICIFSSLVFFFLARAHFNSQKLTRRNRSKHMLKHICDIFINSLQTFYKTNYFKRHDNYTSIIYFNPIFYNILSTYSQNFWHIL